MRIQFYPNEHLEKKLTEESATLGVHVSTLVNDILNKHYGLIFPDALNDMVVEQKVFDELKQFIENLGQDIEFSVPDASSTFRQISMVQEGKPNPLRARIGRHFADMVGKEGSFRDVEQIMIDGKPKRTVVTRSALYKKVVSKNP